MSSGSSVRKHDGQGFATGGPKQKGGLSIVLAWKAQQPWRERPHCARLLSPKGISATEGVHTCASAHIQKQTRVHENLNCRCNSACGHKCLWFFCSCSPPPQPHSKQQLPACPASHLSPNWVPHCWSQLPILSCTNRRQLSVTFQNYNVTEHGRAAWHCRSGKPSTKCGVKKPVLNPYSPKCSLESVIKMLMYESRVN